jgi:hypothetical protein
VSIGLLLLVLIVACFPPLAVADELPAPSRPRSVAAQINTEQLQVAWMSVGLVAGLVSIIYGCLATAYWIRHWPEAKK